jgi:MYXO-CTERM domain-containing protein
MIRRHPVTVASIAAVAATTAAGAAVVPITSNSPLSTSGLGTFIGTLDYTYVGGNAGTLAVTLTNTTPGAIGGFITAFMFRPPPELGAFGSSLTASDFPLMVNVPAGTNGSPFPGTWIGGAGLNGSWLAGGQPQNGIGVGQTGSFSFSITGANASMLTSDSFVSGSLVSDAYAFVVRFRGMAEGGSDKVPANQLPAPGAVALLALAGVARSRRRA